MELDKLIEFNKLIGDFDDTLTDAYPISQFFKRNEDEIIWCTKHQFKYHRTWEWIMPVLEKISKNYSCLISNDSGQWQILIDIASVNVVGDNLFEVVYESIIKFLKWYNKLV